MSDLIVLTYDSEDQAVDALSHIANLKQENVQKPLVAVEDAAVAVKNENGDVKVRQTLESTVKGSHIIGGGFWGILVGFVFGGPLLGAMFGMALSALLGRRIDVGIDNSFIKSVADDLRPGHSALLLLVNGTPADTIAEALSDFGGSLYHTSMPEDVRQAFVDAMDTDNEQLKVAVEDTYELKDNRVSQ